MPEKQVLSVEARLVDEMSKNLDKIKKNIKDFNNTTKSSFKQGDDALKKNEKQVSRLGKVWAGAKSSLVSFTKTFGATIVAMAGAAIIIAGVGNAIRFVQETTEEFEFTMSRVKAILQPTADEFEVLSAKAKELGETTRFTASEAGAAFVELGKLGFKTAESLKTITGVLDLAVIGEKSLADSSILLASTLRQFNLPASESGRIVDVMAKSFTSSALDANKLQESLKFVGTTASLAGLSFEETTSLLAIMAERKIDASIAGTSLNQLLIQLTKSSSKVNKIFKQLGKENLSVQEKMKFLAESGIDVGEAFELLDVRAGRAANVLFQSIDDVDAFTESITKSGGAAKTMADIMLKNVKGATIILKSAQEGLALAIGEAFQKSKTERIEFYTELVRSATKFIKEHKEDLQALASVISGTIKLFVNLGVIVAKVFAKLAEDLNIFSSSASDDLNDFSGEAADVFQEFGDDAKKVVKALEIDTTSFEDFTKGTLESIETFAQGTTTVSDRTRVAIRNNRDDIKDLAADIDKIVEDIQKDPVKPPPPIGLPDEDEIKLQMQRAQQLQSAISQFRLAGIALIEDDQLRERTLLEEGFREQLKIVEGNFEATFALNAAHILEMKALKDKQKNDDESRDQEIFDTKLNATRQLFGGLSALAAQGAKKNKSLAGIAKGTAIAEASIATFQAASKALGGPGAPPFPFNIAAAIGVTAIGLANVSKIKAQSFAKGGDFVTQGPQMIQVGDNPGGRERVQITPMSSPNINGPTNNANLTINVAPRTINITGNPSANDINNIKMADEEMVNSLERIARKKLLDPIFGKQLAGAQ